MLKPVVFGAWVIAAGIAAAWPAGGGAIGPECCATRTPPVATLDLTRFSSEAPAEPLDLAFFHQGVGGQLLAEPGIDDGQGGTHPNGGGLRKLLRMHHYRVHEATQGSAIGEHTELFDWLPKFRDQMPEVLSVDHQDSTLPAGQHNRVVVWKSCYPNNDFLTEGVEPGKAEGPALTVANAKASMRAMLPLFQRQPQTLFVYLTTTPPLAEASDEFALKWLAKLAVGWPTAADRVRTAGRLSRVFSNWVAGNDGWLATYPEHNVVVFNYYDLLTDHGKTDFLRYATGASGDHYPSREGQQKAAAAIVPFLNQSVRRAFGSRGIATAAGPATKETAGVH